MVLFHPLSGGVLTGDVRTVNRRSAVVELHDPEALLEAGTRGEVRVPRQRLIELSARRRAERERREAERRPKLPAPAEGEQRATEEAPETEAERYWNNLDEDYEEGMPLLAEVGRVHPDERNARVSGRTYLLADHVLTSDDGRESGFYRAGLSLEYEHLHLFGRTGDLAFDAEYNQKHVSLPDSSNGVGEDDHGTLRVDRLAYRTGGNRFAPERHELGRFLQHGMPEFGLLDGYEWTRRTDSGQRYGFSAGFMPEPNEDLESGHDFQLAGWYRWVDDLSERRSAALGFQKTWNDGAPDRDLVVGKFHLLPSAGWQLQGSAWVDVYSSGDAAKGSGVGLTQAWLTARRMLDSGIAGRQDSLSVTYTHLEFPDIEREEFLPPDPDELEDERRDRLRLDARRWLREDQRLFASVGVWVDDEDEGLDGELGFEVVLPRSRAHVAAFGAQGAYATSLGLRTSYAHYLEHGLWDVSYEVANQDNQGFADDNDDLLQHRLRASREHHTRSGWSVSGYVEADYWEEEEALTLGLHLQRSF